jgi:hypothetical protein
LDNDLTVDIQESFRSSLQTIQSRDLWKDNQNFSLALNYPLSQSLSLEPSFKSRILKDQLTSFNNDVNHHAAAARFVYMPNSRLMIIPEVTSKWQTQLEQNDQGFGYGLAMNVDDFRFDGYQNDFNFHGMQDFFHNRQYNDFGPYDVEDLSPTRQNNDFRFRYQVKKHFYKSTADTLVVFYDRLRRDSFDFRTDTTSSLSSQIFLLENSNSEPDNVTILFVRSVVNSIRGIRNLLSYDLAPNTILYLRNSIAATTFRVTNIEDPGSAIQKDDAGFESEHTLGIRYLQGSWFSRLGWHYRFRSRKDLRPDAKPDPFGRHATVGFDNEDVLVGLNLRAGVTLSQQDSLGTYVSVSKFAYSTTDTTNPNDHDQLRWQLTFAHSHKFSPALQLVWRATAFLNHFVFISGKYSGGNNWERVLQLTPEIIYQPNMSFYTRQLFVVRSKYLTFDFDDPETSTRNIVNRQFVLANQSSFALLPKTWLDFNFRLELAEQGKLFFEQWRQTLALSWQNYEIQFLIRYRLASGLSIAPGASLFRQVRWQHNISTSGESYKSVDSKHANIGPILETGVPV